MSETITKNILLKDSDGNSVAPITTMENVITSDGSKIENYISDEIQSSASSAKYSETKTINEAITDLNTATSNMYSKTEVDNKFSTLETNVDWKEAVATYSDIATTYPNPQDGWTVNVKDTDYTYRYSGSAWVAISANAIPQATTSVNGLMTTAQVTKLNGIATGAEVNVNADWNATSGDAQILNKPTKVSQFTNDSGFTTNTGTVTSVTVQGSNGLSGSGTVTTSGTVTLSNSGVRSITQDSSDGHKLSINTGGTTSTITIPDNNTTYSAGTGISLSGTTFSNSGVRSITQDSSDGHKLTINTNGTSSTITIPDNNTTYSAATTSAAGLMSASDKTKLDGIASGANAYSLPTASSSTLGGIKVGTNLSISNGVLSATNTTYSDATTSAHGLMTAAMVTKLNGIADGATNVTNNNQLINGAGYITSSGSCSYATNAKSANSATYGAYGCFWDKDTTSSTLRIMKDYVTSGAPTSVFGKDSDGTPVFFDPAQMSVKYATSAGKANANSNGVTIKSYIGRVIYDANFGSLATNASAGSKTFNITVPDGTINAVIGGISGAYGVAYSYSLGDISGTTVSLVSNAMNLSNGTHSVSIRFTILCFG